MKFTGGYGSLAPGVAVVYVIIANNPAVAALTNGRLSVHVARGGLADQPAR